MKHVKLFEQFIESINESSYAIEGEFDAGTQMKFNSAAGKGRNFGRYEQPSKVYSLWEDQTTVKHESEYDTDMLAYAANGLAQYGVFVKEKQLQNGILTVKFDSTVYTYEFKGGKWAATAGTNSVHMDIYEFITAVVAQKYVKYKDKPVGSK